MEGSERDVMVVVLAGGAGTRFWPLSTEDRPKQFLKLLGDTSLLQQSYERIKDLAPRERIFVLTNEAFLPLVREQLPEVPEGNVIGEPLRRDTAPAVILSALLARRLFGNPVLFTVTADHLIEPKGEFLRAAKGAIEEAQRRPVLYTFGVKPTFPSTSYGYLEVGEAIETSDGLEHRRVLSFKEKPDLETAKGYLAEGRYLWNSGMFVWQAEVILEEAARYLPKHLEALDRAANAWGTPRWREALKEAFGSVQAVSIDYGIMERSQRVYCVVAPFQWSDLGGWVALGDYLERDQGGNAYRGRLEVLDAEDNIAFCEDPSERISLIGVRGLVVVRAGKETLIVPKERVEEIKALVERIRSGP